MVTGHLHLLAKRGRLLSLRIIPEKTSKEIDEEEYGLGCSVLAHSVCGSGTTLPSAGKYGCIKVPSINEVRKMSHTQLISTIVAF